MAWRDANQDTETCTKAVVELEEMADRLLDLVTPLETQVGFLIEPLCICLPNSVLRNLIWGKPLPPRRIFNGRTPN
jgi:hypothetical protein